MLAKIMEVLRGMISLSYLASCSSLDNVPGFLILGLLRAIRAPGLPRYMAAQLDYKSFGYYKWEMKKKKSQYFSWTLNSISLLCQVLFVCFLFNRYCWTVAKPMISGCGNLKFNFSCQVPLGWLFLNRTKTSFREQV